MLKSAADEEYEEVFGVAYETAKAQLDTTVNAVRDRYGKGFSSREECLKFIQDCRFDLLVFMDNLGEYRYVNHLGELHTKAGWARRYEDTCFWYEQTSANTRERVSFNASDLDPNFPRKYGEEGDGCSQPLYTRNYFLPKGYYIEKLGAYNTAEAVPCFARETGRDTSHIHTLLRNIGGECYPYLLAWLREKMVRPGCKTEVMPVFVGAQGAGKSSFVSSICTALFGKRNVVVSSKFDGAARFNSDTANALVVSIEEKMLSDKQNALSTLKDLVTNTTVRVEHKGKEPYIQASHTEYVMTSNDLTPIRFEDGESQRRFMVMEVNPYFKKTERGMEPTEQSRKADEVFMKLYGYMAPDGTRVPGFDRDIPLIEQFKYELYKRKGFEGVDYKQFPHTEAYRRCYTLPQTNETKEIEAVFRAITPFVKASLEKEAVQDRVTVAADEGERVLSLEQSCANKHGFQYVQARGGAPARVAVCVPAVFVTDDQFRKPLSHASVQKVKNAMRPWFKENGLALYDCEKAPNGGFKALHGKLCHGTAIWFTAGGEDDGYTETDTETDKDRTASEAARQAEDRESESGVRGENGVVQTIDRREDDASRASGPHLERAAAQLPAVHKRDEIHDGLGLPQNIRVGKRERFTNNGRMWYNDNDGAFETLNELVPGWPDRRKEYAAHLDTFLLEADETSEAVVLTEKRKAAGWLNKQGPLSAEEFYSERLAVQDAEATRLFESGIACRVVYSGSKSLHILVRVADAPQDEEERKWLDAYLKLTLSNKLKFDGSTSDPTRLTRAPVTVERVTECPYNEELKLHGKQRLLAENWDNVYRLQWRGVYHDWLTAPMTAYEARGKKMLPSRKLFKDAAEAILEERFFTDKAFDGKRQEAFFPAYRLLRFLGFGHDELWDEIEKQVEGYKKASEHYYWKSRRYSDIIKAIDAEADAYEEASTEGEDE